MESGRSTGARFGPQDNKTIFSLSQKERNQAMFETLDKLFLAGLGAVTMTKERAEALFEEYVAKGKAKREEKSGFIKEVLDTAEKSRAELEKIIAEQLHKVITQLPLATKEDIERLEEKIDQLLSR